MGFICPEKLHLLILSAACVQACPSPSYSVGPLLLQQGWPVQGREWPSWIPISAGSKDAAASRRVQKTGTILRNGALPWWVCLLRCLDIDSCWENSKIGLFIALLSQECVACKYSRDVGVGELPTAMQERCGGARTSAETSWALQGLPCLFAKLLPM